jgi:FeoC like transcriptional regulator
MLKQVWQEIEAAGGPLSLDALSRRLNIERSVLEGIIQTLVRLGRLRDDGQTLAQCDADCAGCAVASSCAVVSDLPCTYSVVPHEDIGDHVRWD